MYVLIAVPILVSAKQYICLYENREVKMLLLTSALANDWCCIWGRGRFKSLITVSWIMICKARKHIRKNKWDLLLLKLGKIDLITMKNKFHGAKFGLRTTNCIYNKTFECSYGKAHVRRWIFLFLWRGDESKVCQINRVLILPNRGDLNKRSQLLHVLDIFYPQVVFSLFVQFDECFVVLSTTSVIACSIHNPAAFVGKTARCGTAMVLAGNQWNYLRICSKYNSFF